jgi:cell division protein ZipA
MELLRWVLILSGTALLALTFVIGRRKVEGSDGRRSRDLEDAFDPSTEDLSVPIAGRISRTAAHARNDENSDDNFLTDEELDDVLPPKSEYASEITGTQVELGISEGFNNQDLADTPSDASGRRSKVDTVKSFANAVKQASQRNIGAAVSRASGTDTDNNFVDQFEPYSEDFIPEEKIVTVNVMAPKGQVFFGDDLKSVFDAHHYEFGKMSIFHCRHDDHKVFSIANVVQPGSFEEATMDTFETPGITLFMRLPVALDADVAFDFLMREATELAEELGGALKDEDRSTLSKQTIQHMREDIQQYVFRQKSAMRA